jgi:two-component system cell cycle response regulator PopA
MAMGKNIFILSDTSSLDTPVHAYFTDNGFGVQSYEIANNTGHMIPDTPPAVIVVIAQETSPTLFQALSDLESHFNDHTIPVLAILTNTEDQSLEAFDSVLLQPAQPGQILARTQALIRLSHMQLEINMRLETLQKNFGLSIVLPKASSHKPLSVLFIGKASPEFMVVINALQKKYVNVVAAFTSFTAFDYLYEQEFDAVVINGLTSSEPAFSIAETMRKNAKLFPIPILLLVDGESIIHPADAYAKGFNDIVDAGAEKAEINSRIIEQANFHRLHQSLKAQFSEIGGTQCVDQTSKLFNRAFFNAHIARVGQYCQKNNQPVSICLIRVKTESIKNQEPVSISHTYRQIGSIIKNLVRMQDITARLDTNLFAIAFPGQSVAQLDAVSKRLSSIINRATVFDPKTNETIRLELEFSFESLTEETGSSSVA